MENELPEYNKPPIVEVAASIQFADIPRLDTAMLGLLWARFREKYPRAEQHSPLQTVSEPSESNRGPRVRFTMESALPVPRLWFLNSDGTRLVQVQTNRLIVNWRQLDSGEPYVRFSGLMDMLKDAFGEFKQFIQDEQLGPIVLNHSELTYVNHIRAGEKGLPREPLSKYVSCWKPEIEFCNLEAAEEISFRTQYAFDRTSSSIARLFVELDSGYTASTEEPIYIMNLTARRALNSEGFEDAINFLHEAHRRIVTSFTSFTTSEAHQLWERNQ